MNKSLGRWICALLLTHGVATAQHRKDFPDVLDIKYTVTDTRRISTTLFSDQGAWHAYSASDNGFSGPLLMDLHGEWLSDNFARLELYEGGQRLPMNRLDSLTHYYPGLLQQGFRAGSYTVVLQLLFADNRQSVLQATIRNNGTASGQLRMVWSGKALPEKAVVTADKDVTVKFNGSRHLFRLSYQHSGWDIKVKDRQYTAARVLTIRPGATATDVQVHGFYHAPANAAPLPSFEKLLAANEQRWDNYLAQLFQRTHVAVTDTQRARLAVKSVMTLLTNWRSPAGDLHHAGVFPSAAYQGFYGFWAWDSWKQAAALAYFHPQLAKDNILAMFDYQDSTGMIADCIYTDHRENNLRDTKPPLAAWGVWEVFTASADTAFLKKMYPLLVRYHEWWYRYRDHDHNGWCEYGATDGTRLAAAWESGMDNAVRFDSARIIANSPGAWSLDQESVDLNAYLIKEKLYLAEMAGILGIQAGWQKEAETLARGFSDRFYHHDFYYDHRMTGQKVTVKGAEGWLPLWAGLSNKEQATAVAKVMADTTLFNTRVSLPVLAAAHPMFNPANGYWRGPVWIDQFYFGVKGLKDNGHAPLAQALTNSLWQHAAGMKDGGPYYENYHPLSGKGLNARGFSWTAAHVLLLLAEGL